MKDIYIVQGGVSTGPFDDAEIKQNLASGKFRPKDLAWRPGLTAWTPLTSLEKNRTTLSTTFATEPPPVPPLVVREKNKLITAVFLLVGLVFLISKLTPPAATESDAETKAGFVPVPQPPAVQDQPVNPASEGKGEKLEAVFFEKDSAVVNDSGQQVLERVTTLLQTENYQGFQTITLIGFASSEGEMDHNDKLSMERAQAVKSHLVEKGLPDQKIVVAPLGQADKGNPEDRNPEMNRRVEILVVR